MAPVSRLDPPDVTIVTGAGGWLGRALVDHLVRADGPFTRPGRVRALVMSADDAAALGALDGRPPQPVPEERVPVGAGGAQAALVARNKEALDVRPR